MRRASVRLARTIGKGCVQADIPFLIEPITYPVSGGESDPAVFAALKAQWVVNSARDLTPLGVDVLKAEFPADMRYVKDEGKLRAACQQLDEASQTPWILLSAGVAFDEFARQVKIACQAGASGFLGGRAIWDEAMQMSDAQQRRHWLSTIGVERMRRLHEIAGEFGRTWWSKWGNGIAALTDVQPDWYRLY